MTIRFASLGSGSKGNGTLVESNRESVLIDCGFSIRETEKRLARLGRSGADISAILVTHEHGDHWRGVFPLARKYGLPVYMTAGTARACKAAPGQVRVICGYTAFCVGDITVLPVTVPHDAREPVQYTLTVGHHKLGVLTDLGCITPHVVAHYRDCDGLLLEANHDVDMLAQGPYPAVLKRRVGSDWGHLNNQQAAGLLAQVIREKLQCLVMGHISQQNNHPGRVQDAIRPYQDDVKQIHYAGQEQGFGWQLLD